MRVAVLGEVSLPRATRYVSHCSLLAPMGKETWRRPGTPALSTPTARPLGFHQP